MLCEGLVHRLSCMMYDPVALSHQPLVRKHTVLLTLRDSEMPRGVEYIVYSLLVLNRNVDSSDSTPSLC